MPTSLNSRVFFETRKALTLATRVDVLPCISLVRRQVADFLLMLSVEDDIVRLAKSDIAETLLSQEALRIAADPVYQETDKQQDREALMTVALGSYLFGWIVAGCRTDKQKALVQSSASRYAAALIGTSTPE